MQKVIKRVHNSNILNTLRRTKRTNKNISCKSLAFYIYQIVFTIRCRLYQCKKVVPSERIMFQRSSLDPDKSVSVRLRTVCVHFWTMLKAPYNV